MRIIILLAATMLLASHSFATSKEVKTKAKWGNSSDNCRGRGICKAKTTTQNSETSSFDASWEFNAASSQLLLTISAETLESAPDEIASEISEGYFTLVSSVEFPNELSSELGCEGVLRIPAGEYSVAYRDDHYTIRFTIEYLH